MSRDEFRAWCKEQGNTALALQFVYDDENRVTGVVKRVSRSLLPVYEVLQKIENPVLPRIQNIQANEDVLLVTEEYIAGKSLRFFLDEEGAQDDAFAISAATDILEALDILHSHIPPIIHRDIKPDNVIKRDDGRFVLIDFDAARDYSASAQNDTINLGTHGYASPEQYGFAQTDARSDLYSLGVLLYELRMGERYHRGAVCEGMLAPIVQKCTQFEPNSRYQSAAEVKAAIGSLHQDKPRVKRVIAGICCVAALVGAGLLFIPGVDETAANIPALATNTPVPTQTPLQQPARINLVDQATATPIESIAPTPSPTPDVQLDREQAELDGFLINEQNVLTKYEGPGGHVTIPAGVTAIYDSAFQSNKKITALTIPEGVTSIGRQAFSACTNLKEIAFPQSLTQVGLMAFWRVPWLDAHEEEYVIVGDGILLHYRGRGGDIIIPEEVKVIGSTAFYTTRSRVKSVTLPYGLREIGERAFEGCHGIAEITIPGSVGSIRQEAFNNCDGLKTVMIEDGVLEIEYRAFCGCDILEAVVIPDSVVRMGAQMFLYAPKKLTIYASGGSYAQMYASDNEIRHKTGLPPEV
ncbi:leucine-rich repeat protein [Christensenellaceae bacterium OttesenSCG-928-M15]|nr:leucine-rich repeat protein [Christensenellaceae bacterium OttesenSCG-928-M15]